MLPHNWERQEIQLPHARCYHLSYMKTKFFPTAASAIMLTVSCAFAQSQSAFLKKWQTSLPDFITEVAAAAEASAKSDTPSNIGALRTRLGNAMRQFESQPVQWEITFERFNPINSLVTFKEAGKENSRWHGEGSKLASPEDSGDSRYQKGLVGYYVTKDSDLHQAYPTRELIYVRVSAERRAFADFAVLPANSKLTIKGRVQKITGLPVMYDDKKTPKALSKGYLHRWILSVEVVSAVPSS